MRRSSRDRKKLVIFMLMFSIASLSIGFAAFSTTLNISSSASVNPNSNSFSVKLSSKQDSIVDGKVKGIQGPSVSSLTDAIISNNTLNSTISNLSATFTGGGYAGYNVYIINTGEYTAYLNSINFNGDKVCEAVGDTTPALVDQACENIHLSVMLKEGNRDEWYEESTQFSNKPIYKGEVMPLYIQIAYTFGGFMADGDYSVTLPEISLVFSTIDQPGYTPSIMGSGDVPGTLNSKIKADALFKGTDANVNFGVAPETGVYVRSGTENHVNPIYYYRGAVTNNNVLFANKCWKIVRTTETGGIKLIYNGTPTADNKCNGDNSMIAYSTYNNNYNDEEDESYIYSDGTNSIVKQAVDTWYASDMDGYTDKLEDTEWCNDSGVTFSGYNEAWQQDMMFFAGYDRNGQNYQPSLHCAAEHSLTVSSTQGSNKMTYPVGLLTADELTLAGMGWNGFVENGYLNNHEYWWTMTPYYLDGFDAAMFIGGEDGGLSGMLVGSVNGGIRPAVSLKPGTMVTTGEGTSSKPYIIE